MTGLNIAVFYTALHAHFAYSLNYTIFYNYASQALFFYMNINRLIPADVKVMAANRDDILFNGKKMISGERILVKVSQVESLIMLENR